MEVSKLLEERQMEERFYHISDNTNYSRGWAFASKIYPLSDEKIIDCELCGRRGRYPTREFAVDLEGGNKLPDFLQCSAYPLMIVSQKVVDDWKSEGISGFSFYLVTIRNIPFPKKYYHVVIEGECEADLETMGFEIVKQCPNCSEVFFDKPLWINTNFFIKHQSWDGKDLFTARYFPRIVLCTEKLLETARRNKHTARTSTDRYPRP
jgi:hypothetical protein